MLPCGTAAKISKLSLRKEVNRVPTILLSYPSSNRRQNLPSPDTHRVLGFELVTKVARENADLTSMMCIMLNKMNEHVDGTARHPFHSGVACRKGDLEQAREIFGGLA